MPTILNKIFKKDTSQSLPSLEITKKIVSSQSEKSQSLQELSKFLKIISDPTRLKILQKLQSGPMNVGQIQASLGVPLNLTSFHLRPLKKANLVLAKKVGLNVIYSLNEAKVCNFRKYLNYFLCAQCQIQEDQARTENLIQPDQILVC